MRVHGQAKRIVKTTGWRESKWPSKKSKKLEQRPPGTQAVGNRFAREHKIACLKCERGPNDGTRRYKQVRWHKWGVSRLGPWIICRDCARSQSNG